MSVEGCMVIIYGYNCRNLCLFYVCVYYKLKGQIYYRVIFKEVYDCIYENIYTTIEFIFIRESYTYYNVVKF